MGNFNSNKTIETMQMNEGALSRIRLCRELLELTQSQVEESLDERSDET